MKYFLGCGIRRPLFLFYLLVPGLLLVPGYTVRAESDAFARLREKANRIQTLQADFVQKKQLKILVTPLISEGCFVFKAPDSIRWEYKRPVESILLMHRGEIRRFFRKNGKMVRDSAANIQAMQVVMQNITRWLGGHFDNNPDFTTQLKGNSIRLTPAKSMAGIIDHIELILSDSPGMIDRIHIFEDRENHTTIEFKALKINQPLADVVFQEIK